MSEETKEGLTTEQKEEGLATLHEMVVGFAEKTLDEVQARLQRMIKLSSVFKNTVGDVISRADPDNEEDQKTTKEAGEFLGQMNASAEAWELAIGIIKEVKSELRAARIEQAFQDLLEDADGEPRHDSSDSTEETEPEGTDSVLPDSEEETVSENNA